MISMANESYISNTIDNSFKLMEMLQSECYIFSLFSFIIISYKLAW